MLESQLVQAYKVEALGVEVRIGVEFFVGTAVCQKITVGFTWVQGCLVNLVHARSLKRLLNFWVCVECLGTFLK